MRGGPRKHITGEKMKCTQLIAHHISSRLSTATEECSQLQGVAWQDWCMTCHHDLCRLTATDMLHVTHTCTLMYTRVVCNIQLGGVTCLNLKNPPPLLLGYTPVHLHIHVGCAGLHAHPLLTYMYMNMYLPSPPPPIHNYSQ